MPNPRPSLTLRRLLWLVSGLAVLLLPLVGCDSGDGIKQYEAPRIEPPKVRMDVAIIKAADSTWFFKLMGPKEVVDQNAEAFDTFLGTVRFTKEGPAPVIFQPPADWHRESASSQRFAAFTLGPENNPAELTVVRLGDKAGSLLLNVNRWRGQLGLKEVGEADLKELCIETKIGDLDVTRVDLTAQGRFHLAAPKKMPAGDNPAAPKLHYDTPADWVAMPEPPQFAIAGFQIEQGMQRATVSVSPMAPQPLLLNVNRWRSQVGLGAIDESQLADAVQKLDVGGVSAQSLDFAGKDRRLLVVLVPRGQSIVIYKMLGSPELVAKQKSAFETFVRSVRFDGGSDE